MVAHSFAELNKAAGDQFNHRVAECRLASVVSNLIVYQKHLNFLWIYFLFTELLPISLQILDTCPKKWTVKLEKAVGASRCTERTE